MNRHYPALLMALIAACLVLAVPSPASAYDYTYARVVRLSLVQGEVQVARPQNGEQSDSGWEQAVVNLPIQQGYSVATGQGRVEIEFESGATARLAENSLLQFTELALSNGGRITRLTLTQGTATFYANLAHDDSFVVATPHLQAVIPKNARFRVDVSDDGTQVSAFKGEVEVDSRAGTNRLTKGHLLSYRTDDADRVALDRVSRSDDWDRWVADRDEVIHTASNAELQYVSSPYSYGMSDLYNYGSWYSFGGYGLCWRPYGVGFDWSPFWFGRWAFLPGLGWTWVSYEPWGWLPYHYGRWAFSPSLGWLWVPGNWQRWHPALVTWVRAGDRVGWVPMHPGDQPGRTPGNLQQGIIITGSNGFANSNGNARKLLKVDDRLEVLRDPPQGFAGAAQPTKSKYIGPPVPTSAGGNSGQQGIVFDPKERKFVNHPGGGAGRGKNVGDAHAETDQTPAAHGAAGKPPSKQVFQPPAPRGNSGGTAPAGDHNAPPQKVSPPPARTPPPPSPPRTESSSPPKMERPAPRSESPRPAPPAQHWRTESRPSSPPPAPRGSESRAPARSGRP